MTGPKPTCADCFLHPEMWIAVPGKYQDRQKVVCGKCGRWIGYRRYGQEAPRTMLKNERPRR